jgi:hypothetical protein
VDLTFFRIEGIAQIDVLPVATPESRICDSTGQDQHSQSSDEARMPDASAMRPSRLIRPGEAVSRSNSRSKRNRGGDERRRSFRFATKPADPWRGA